MFDFRKLSVMFVVPKIGTKIGVQNVPFLEQL